MDIGLGLPAAVPGTRGTDIVNWAGRGEALGFSALGVLDRLVYPSLEPLGVLAAASAVTSRIRLTTSVLVPAYRGSAVNLAKQIATLDQLSDGRLVLGLGAGGRPEEFASTGVSYARRGTRLTEIIRELQALWRSEVPGREAVVPALAERKPLPIILGGRADETFERVAQHADGWIAAGGNAAIFSSFADKARRAWRRAGRPGSPRLMSIGYFALGQDAESVADRYLMDYYAFLGPGAQFVAKGTLTDPGALRREVPALAEAGCDELILFPCSSDPDQADRLADVLL